MARKAAKLPHPSTVTLESKLAWAEREFEEAQRYYPQLVKLGVIADRQAMLNRLAILEAIRNDYQRALEKRDAKT
jgi:hypothetical protein